MNNISEQLFEAVKIITDQRLSNIAYDTTLICTVFDASDSLNGKYIVSDGSVKFEAYSEVSSYKEKDVVRVLIPKGNYSEKKFIQGKYVSDNDSTPITYVSPLGSIVDITGNIANNIQNNSFYIQANGKIKEKKLWEIDLKNSEFFDLQNNNIFDTIFIKSSFQTLLQSHKVIEGNYGLRLDFDCVIDPNQATGITYHAYFDSSEFFGNPYSFSIFSNQEKRFDLTKWPGVILRMSLWLYQDNNFKFLDGNNKSQILPELGFENITVSDLYVGFGMDITKIEDNTVKIYTNDSLNFNTDNPMNQKDINLLWFNKSENNEYLGFSDGIYDDTYDEIEYLQKAHENNRLVTQLNKKVPTDETSLRISADIEEFTQITEQVLNTMTEKYVNTLRGYLEHTEGLWENSNIIGDFLSRDYDNYYLSIENNLKILKKYFEEALYLGMLRQREELISAAITIPTIRFNSDIILHMKNFISEIDNLSVQVKNRIDIGLEIFQNIYDDYKYRLDKLNENLSKLIEKLEQYAMDNWFDELDDIIHEENYFLNKEPYSEKNLDEYHNKYCIYWYIYDKTLIEPEDENFLSKGWRRLTSIGSNIGLPIGQQENGYYVKRPNSSTGSLKVNLIEENPSEKFTAVLFYNHEMFISNEIEFLNDALLSNSEDVDKSRALYIEHNENSLSLYQLYGEGNFLINPAEAHRKRLLRARFDGETGSDEKLIGSQIFWFVPQNSTMLTTVGTDYDEKFYSDKLETYGSLEALNSAFNKGLAYKDRTYLIENSLYKYINNTWSKTGEVSEKVIQDTLQIKKGYTCFYKKIETLEDTYFPYHISSYYSPTFVHNGIYCEVKIDNVVYKSEIFFDFTTYGTNGTDYTLSLIPNYIQPMVLNNKGMSVAIELRDYNNEKINISDSDIELSWLGNSNYLIDSIENGKTYIKRGNTSAYFGILKCVLRNIELENFRNAEKLTSYLPIPYSNSDKYYIEGASWVIYNSAGNEPQYYKNPYKLFDKTTHEQINAIWEIKHSSNDNKFTPNLNEENCLVPCAFYVDDSENPVYSVVIAKNQSGNVLWAQPLLILQNRYGSPMLNSWDGSLQINEENGTILSTMVGAGRKNSNNQFEGVLMGDVGGTVYDGATGLGLYGYHQGAQSFHFGIDGTAFIGKSGGGRIEFDGNKAVIQSASRRNEGKDDGPGMKIDLDDGYIDINGVDNSYPKIRIDQKDPYLTIDSNEDNEIIHIGSNEYYLQSDGYETGNFELSDGEKNSQEPGHGTKFDLKTGLLDSYNLKLISKNVYLDSSDNSSNYFVVKNNDGRNLLYLGDNSQYLQSADYNETEGAEDGVKLDLKNGSLIGYDFKLHAGNNKTYTEINSNAEKSQVIVKNDGKTLFDVGSNKFLLQSKEYTEGTSGLQLDLIKGTIKGHDISISSKTGESSFEIQSDGDPFLKFIHEGNTIVELSTSKQFLQSVDWDGSSIGTKIDLANGKITSYDFTLHAGDKNSFIELNSGNPYILVYNEGFKLFEVSKDDFILQTANFEVLNEDQKTFIGTQIDLKKGTIKGDNLSIYSTDGNGSYIRFETDGSPYLKIHHKDETYDIDLIEISKNNYFLQSKDWNEELLKGTRIDLEKGNITSHNFTLEAKDEDGSFVLIDSGGNPYFQVHHKDTNIDLININKYDFYLQSKNWNGSEIQPIGLKIDISNGKIIGSDFSLYAKADNNSITLNSDGNPFFNIHYGDFITIANPNGFDLVNITNSEFVLRSQNWDPGADGSGVWGTGMELDLTEGKITTNNFNLKATVSNPNSVYYGSSVRLTDGSNLDIINNDGNFEPFFRIWYCNSNTNANLALVEINSENFIFQSNNYDDSSSSSAQGKIVSVSGPSVPFYDFETGSSGSTINDGTTITILKKGESRSEVQNNLTGDVGWVANSQYREIGSIVNYGSGTKIDINEGYIRFLNDYNALTLDANGININGNTLSLSGSDILINGEIFKPNIELITKSVVSSVSVSHNLSVVTGIDEACNPITSSVSGDITITASYTDVYGPTT